MRVKGFLLFLVRCVRRDFCSFFPHTYISSFHWSLNYSILFSYQFWIFTALQQCWERNISSLLAVLKFYHPTFDLFLPVIQEEIPFNESSILLLLYVTSDLFLLVSIARSLKCCSQRRSTLMVTNEVSTLADLYCSCLRFCKWAGIALPMFHFHNGLELASRLGVPSSFNFVATGTQYR